MSSSSRLLAVFGLNLAPGSSSGAIKPILVPHHPRQSPAAPPAATKPGAPVISSTVPPALAASLIDHEVIVVEIFNPGQPGAPVIDDLEAHKEAKAGAKLAGAGFVSVDVRNEAEMQLVGALVTVSSDPYLFIVDRAGKVLFQRGGYLDADAIAQATANALAGEAATDQIPHGSNDGISGPYDGYWKAKVDQVGCQSIDKADAIEAGTDLEKLDGVAKVWSRSLSTLQTLKAIGPDAHYLGDILNDVGQAIAQLHVMTDALRHHKVKAFNAASTRFAAVHNHLFKIEASAGVACFNKEK